MSLLAAADVLPRLHRITIVIAGLPPGRDRALNAKVKLFNAITQVMVAQEMEVGKYIIDIQCNADNPKMRFKLKRPI